MEKFLSTIGIDILLENGLTTFYIIGIILEIIFLAYVIKELFKKKIIYFLWKSFYQLLVC